jgi:hypothetical protein
MALKSIVEIVRGLLPYLLDTDNEAIQDALENQYIMLQPYTLLLDDGDKPVDAESSYTKLQRLLLANLTAYQMVVSKAAKSAGAGAAGSRVLKRSKADVVEAEFETVKASDAHAISLDTSALLSEFKSAACTIARELGYSLPLCGSVEGEFVPFITLQDSVGYWPGSCNYSSY